QSAPDHGVRRHEARSMAHDGGQELVASEREQDARLSRPYGRRPRDITDERDLPEVVARPQSGDGASVDEDVERACIDDVEALSGCSLLDDLLACRCGLPEGKAGEALDRRLR